MANACVRGQYAVSRRLCFWVTGHLRIVGICDTDVFDIFSNIATILYHEVSNLLASNQQSVSPKWPVDSPWVSVLV